VYPAAGCPKNRTLGNPFKAIAVNSPALAVIESIRTAIFTERFFYRVRIIEQCSCAWPGPDREFFSTCDNVAIRPFANQAAYSAIMGFMAAPAITAF
jgi:hypothetical protein